MPNAIRKSLRPKIRNASVLANPFAFIAWYNGLSTLL